MDRPRKRRVMDSWAAFVVVTALTLVSSPARAGGGPENVLVLFNSDSEDASALASYYARQRDVPFNRLCGVQSIDPEARSISFEDYIIHIHDPMAVCLQNLPDPNEIDYVVIIRGLPYRVDLPGDGYRTSLSAMIQVFDAVSTTDGTFLAGQPQLRSGSHYQASVLNPVYVQGDLHVDDFTVQNQYSNWYDSATGIVRAGILPSSFRSSDAHHVGQWDLTGNLFIVTRLDGFDFEDARALVDRSVASDGTFPTGEILCMAGSDQARGARDPECEFVTRYLAAAGFNAIYVDPFDAALSGHQVVAYLTGTADLTEAIAGNRYLPGAITDNLTSTGAAPGNFFCSADGSVCPASESQTSIARFIRAGATGAHGTVAEPLNNVFPNAGVLLLYTFGYNLGESFFFNQRFVYWVNLYLGDPLASPYAERPLVQVFPEVLPIDGVLTVDATHPAGIAQVRLYLDGGLVAQQDGAHLDFVPAGMAVGDRYSVLAVAIAKNVIQHRAGWPEEEQHPRPDIQGWKKSRVRVVSAALLDAGVDSGIGDGVAGDFHADVAGLNQDGGPPASSESRGGCDCRTEDFSGSRDVWWILLLLVLAMMRRQRPRW